MLRCKNLSELRIYIAMAKSISLGCEFIVAKLFGTELICSKDNVNFSSTLIANQVSIRWSDGREFLLGFYLPQLNAPRSVAQFVTLPRALQQLEVIKKLNLCQDGTNYGNGVLIDPTALSFKHSHWYRLSDGREMWTGSLLIQESQGLPFEPPPDRGRIVKFSKRFRIQGFGLLIGNLVEDNQILIEQLYLERNREQIKLDSTIELVGGNLLFRLKGGEVNAITDGELGLRVRLDLGEIEIPVEDVIELEAGSVIELERSETLEATLVIEGREIAQALLELTNDKAKLRVVKVLSRL